jgi:hypothetical protein
VRLKTGEPRAPGTGLADRVDRGSLQPSGHSGGLLRSTEFSIGKAALILQALIAYSVAHARLGIWIAAIGSRLWPVVLRRSVVSRSTLNSTLMEMSELWPS